MSVSSNRALSGGTIFWVAQLGNTSTALDISSDTNNFDKNAAAYGERIATQAVHFGGVSDRVSISSSPAVLPPFTFTILDYYGQKVQQSASVVSTEVVNVDQETCGGNLPSFVNYTGSLPVNSGVANFSSVLARCDPGYSMTVKFSSPTQVFTALNALVSYSFNPCQAGDTYMQGTCSPCPEGQFSPSYTGPSSTKCQSCNDIPGVASCSGSTLVLESGYWRQSSTTSSVLQCEQPGNRCLGGAWTGDASCKPGSQGPLCGVCSEGYFAGYNGDCLECDSDGAGISGGVVVILLVCGLVVAFYCAK